MACEAVYEYNGYYGDEKKTLFEYNHQTTLYEPFFFFCQFDNKSPQEKKKRQINVAEE